MTEPAARPWRVRVSARARIVGWFVLLLVFAVGASVLLLRHILLDRLDDEVTAHLEQEVAELRSLATDRDPQTGDVIEVDVQTVFDTFLTRNVPNEGEALFTFVDGVPYKASFAAPDALDRDPEAVSRWANVDATATGSVDSAAGPVRYLAVPVEQDGAVVGVFVVANFVQGERAEVDEAIRAAAAASIVVLIVASLLAWIVAGRVLAPVRSLTDTARSITDTDLTRRLPVRGHDELTELTETFNAMLDRLESAFVTQRAFMDDVGHELRTPITIIRGHLELLGDDPEERREVVAIVTDELDRMSRQVDDMLLLAKAEQPGFVECEPFDLGQATRDWETKMAALDARDWRLAEAATGIVVADRHRLTQAVMNLAENAAHHTAPGDAITIGSALSNGHARIWLRDEGSGIEADDQRRIFDRFARVGERPGRTQGSGLGLAIVRAVAEAHGGTVEVQSSPGTGSTFTIVIPNRPSEGAPWPAS